MADIRKVLGKGKEYDIEGLKIELKPLKVKDMDIILALQNPSKKDKAMKDFSMVYLTQAFPDAKKGELDDVEFTFVNKLLECAMDVNGLSGDEKSEDKPVDPVVESVEDGNKE